MAPDIEVGADLAAFQNGHDPVLASALAFLRREPPLNAANAPSRTHSTASLRLLAKLIGEDVEVVPAQAMKGRRPRIQQTRKCFTAWGEKIKVAIFLDDRKYGSKSEND